MTKRMLKELEDKRKEVQSNIEQLTDEQYILYCKGAIEGLDMAIEIVTKGLARKGE